MLALWVLVAFLVMHVAECAVSTTDGEAHATAAPTVAASALDVAGHEDPTEGHHDCGHQDGHDHDGVADDVHAAAPRTSDPGATVTAPASAPSRADWSLASLLLFTGLRRRRCHRSTPASSYAGRQLLILVSIDRE
ncbi:MAG: hypothetical protein M3R63_17475 [Actinomycetota bacterium]|nr:hypothetical protein [Actinomycetota bacterium]